MRGGGNVQARLSTQTCACLPVCQVLGGHGEMWGETVDASDLQQTVWPRLAAVAEKLWSPRAATAEARAAAPRIARLEGVLTAPPGHCHVQLTVLSPPGAGAPEARVCARQSCPRERLRHSGPIGREAALRPLAGLGWALRPCGPIHGSKAVDPAPALRLPTSGFRCLLNERGIAAAPVANAEARSAPPGPGSCLAQRRRRRR